MATITIVLELTGTDREKGFKEGELIGKVRNFVEGLTRVETATITDLPVGDDVTLYENGDRRVTKHNGIFNESITEADLGVQPGA